MNVDREKLEGEEKLGLWVGLLGPPAAWLLNLQTNYSLVPWTCRHGKFFLVHLSSLLFLGLAAAAGFIAWTSWRAALRTPEGTKNKGMHEVAPFMGQIGIWMSALFAFLIVMTAVPSFILSPCAE